MQAADLQIVQVPIDDLRPDPANPRKISDAELEALTRSLREFGFVQPVLARAGAGLVIGGHQRLLAARRLGWKQVPVIFLEAPDSAMSPAWDGTGGPRPGGRAGWCRRPRGRRWCG
jgi:ParB/RepB/Spo0J family partition protein